MPPGAGQMDIFYVEQQPGGGAKLTAWKIPAEGGEATGYQQRSLECAGISRRQVPLLLSSGVPNGSIWRVPLEGGEESLVVSRVTQEGRNRFAQVESGKRPFVQYHAGLALLRAAKEPSDREAVRGAVLAAMRWTSAAPWTDRWKMLEAAERELDED